MLAFFALVVIGPGHRTRLMLALASFVAVFGYYSLISAANIDRLPAPFAAWIPNAVFVVAAIVRTMTGSARSSRTLLER